MDAVTATDWATSLTDARLTDARRAGRLPAEHESIVRDYGARTLATSGLTSGIVSPGNTEVGAITSQCSKKSQQSREAPTQMRVS